jgi:hypothetical protein
LLAFKDLITFLAEVTFPTSTATTTTPLSLHRLARVFDPHPPLNLTSRNHVDPFARALYPQAPLAAALDEATFRVVPGQCRLPQIGSAVCWGILFRRFGINWKEMDLWEYMDWENHTNEDWFGNGIGMRNTKSHTFSDNDLWYTAPTT